MTWALAYFAIGLVLAVVSAWLLGADDAEDDELVFPLGMVVFFLWPLVVLFFALCAVYSVSKAKRKT